MEKKHYIDREVKERKFFSKKLKVKKEVGRV